MDIQIKESIGQSQGSKNHSEEVNEIRTAYKKRIWHTDGRRSTPTFGTQSNAFPLAPGRENTNCNTTRIPVKPFIAIAVSNSCANPTEGGLT